MCFEGYVHFPCLKDETTKVRIRSLTTELKKDITKVWQ